MSPPGPPRPSGPRPGARLRAVGLAALLALIGLLPVLPVLAAGSPILNNDMLVAYFAYFWDFHANWSWGHPLVFWSSSYQCGMPMHAYWQSGFLYPVTWILFGPLSPHYGIYLFYAFHFALGAAGFLKLGPHLRLKAPAALWAGLCFSLSGTMLARYEHATYLAGWAWMPLVLAAFLDLRDRPGLRTLLVYAGCVALQALGGHPQASATTALLIAGFTVTSLLRRPEAPEEARPGGGRRGAQASRGRRSLWLAAGHLLALLYCAPLVVPFVDLLGQTDRFDGTAWEEGKPSEASAAGKLEEGVFSFRKFSTGGARPLHLLSLAAPHALGTPSNASWWGGEAWGEVFVFIGALGLFFCLRASWKRAGFDMRVLWIGGLIALWLAAGAHFGASQILYHLPVLNNFRRPARYLIVFVLALSALSGHGFQRFTAGSHRGRPFWIASAALLLLAALFLALRLPGPSAALLDAVRQVKPLDPAKDYAGKIAALLFRWAGDAAALAGSAAALAWFTRRRPAGRKARNLKLAALFAVLLLDLLRVHWDHFYLFPASFYRTPPATVAALDEPTRPFWRVSHYIEYPGLEHWRMHNDPLAHFELFEREKNALSHGIHAVFGYDHVSAHLPMVWKWPDTLTDADKGARYLLSNRVLAGHDLSALERFGDITVHAREGWKPRFEWRPGKSPETGPCPPGYAGHQGLCVHEARDGDIRLRAPFSPGDTLIVRERFQDAWRYRLDGGPWLKPLETPEHFQRLEIPAPAAEVELGYSPAGFYRLAAVPLLVTGFLFAGFAFFRRFRP